MKVRVKTLEQMKENCENYSPPGTIKFKYCVTCWVSSMDHLAGKEIEITERFPKGTEDKLVQYDKTNYINGSERFIITDDMIVCHNRNGANE